MERNFLNKYLMAALSFLIVASGCSKFGDENVSPNATETPLTSALLTNAESAVVTEAQNSATNSNTQHYVQYFVQVNYPDRQLYSATAVSWDALYSGPLEDLQNIINTVTAAPDPLAAAGNTVNQIQVARILKAYYFSILTDRYGDIPYFDALKRNVLVKYDKQQDVYADLFKELKEAAAAFQATGTAIKGDVIYQGSIAKWKRLANSLRLVLAMRLSKVDPVKGKTEFLASLSDASGLIDDNTYNFQINWPGGSFANPYFNMTTATFLAIANTIADKLNGYKDPRIFAYGRKNASGNVKGVPYGMNRNNNISFTTANPDWSLIFDASWRADNSVSVVVSAAYIDLLRAEAAVVYATGENPATLLAKGIQDSWAQWKVTGEIATYLTAIGVSGTPTAATIQEQLWIALYGSSQFAWDEWRRTGVPILSPAPDATNNSKQIPRRYAYPTTEAQINAAAYSAAVKAFPYGGADDNDNRVWWDKK